MISFTSQIILFLESVMLASVVLMHLARKNFTAIVLYAVQSLIIVFALFYSSFREASLLLMVAAMATLFVKLIIAPYFFLKLIKKHQLQFSASTYLNTPTTLMVLAVLIAFSYSHFFKPLTVLAPYDKDALILSVGMMFVSIFLIINRKGLLSQMAGTLSLENAIVSFAYITGLETTAGPQIAIIFDIFIWVIIATIFASMVYQHFGSIDASNMKQLKEE